MTDTKIDDIEPLPKFTSEPECPKCGWMQMDWIGKDESIALMCDRCGWEWEMEAKDAI